MLLWVLGTFTGTLSGLLGIGGGLLMVPILTMFGVPLVEATATSLVGVFLSSVSGSIRNLSMRELHWQVSLVLAAFGVFTAQAGAWLGDRVPDQWLSIAFAGLLLLTIYLINLRQSLKNRQVATSAQPETVGRPVPSPPIRFTPTAGIGLLVGLLSGLFGVGGGLVMVPLQMLLLNEPIKSAVRTSLGAIVAIAISALAQHALNGNVLWIPGLCLGLGGMIGAQIGTRLLPKLTDQTVGWMFRWTLMILAAYMVVRVLFR
ncbi:MAG: sulfite exporter TauE/SafE family protein [Timaviella obliquedivisa GSE-PSE-MK23-08B]|nr:sulfite exporter TauE/SafE family protein [Timaviella obliquedivisa GSE-PSE-MK23-08B]